MAFSYCNVLKSVTIPSSVVCIGERAFYRSNLTTVYSYAETPAEFSEGFASRDNYTYGRATLYVPKGKKEAYMSTESWKYFKNIVEMDETAVNEITADEAGTKVTGFYSIHGVVQDRKSVV